MAMALPQAIDGPQQGFLDNLVEWAKDEAFRKGIAGFHNNIDDLQFDDCEYPKNFDTFTVSERPLRRRQTTVRDWADYMNQGKAQDEYLANDESARGKLNSELNRLLLKAGVSHETLNKLGAEYLGKVKMLDEIEHPKDPLGKRIKVKVLREAHWTPKWTNSVHTEYVDCYISAVASWKEAQKEITLCYRDDQGTSTQSRSKGNWIYCFPGPEYQKKHAINKEQDYLRMVSALKAKQAPFAYMLQESMQELEQECQDRKVRKSGLARALEDNLTWQSLEDDGTVVDYEFSWDKLKVLLKKGEAANMGPLVHPECGFSSMP